MKPMSPPPEISRQDLVSFCLRQCALQIDPRYGRLPVLAQEFDLHESTLGVWIRNGRIPRKACKRLAARFGKKMIDIEVLSA